MIEKNSANVMIAIAIIMGFVFIVSLAMYFVTDYYSLVCSCRASMQITIAALASLGVFVGAVTHYRLSKTFVKERETVIRNLQKTLDFLEPEERKILKALLDNQGVLAQNQLSKATKITPVKLHRRLASLEAKNIIRKEKNGMTNNVIVDEELRELFTK